MKHVKILSFQNSAFQSLYLKMKSFRKHSAALTLDLNMIVVEEIYIVQNSELLLTQCIK